MTKHRQADASGQGKRLLFVLDSNLGLPVEESPWKELFECLDIETTSTNDMVRVDGMLAEHGPDIAFIPAGDFHRLTAGGDHTYVGIAIATSKFTGQPRLKSLLIVRKDDPAESLDDLEGARCSYINRSCSSTYFPPAILLNRTGRKLEDYFEIVQIEPGALWQGPVKAVVSEEVRTTMVLEDMWKSVPENAETTKVIDEYVGGTPAVIVVKDTLDEKVRSELLDVILAWTPPWEDKIFGAFKPYYYADVHLFFHDLGQLPAGF